MTSFDYRHAILQAGRDCASQIAVEDAEARLSFGELCALAGGLAEQLRALDRPPGRPAVVAIVAGPGCWQIAAMVGIAAGGFAFMPVDPTMPEARIRAMLDQAQPVALVCLRATAALAAAAAPEQPLLLIDSVQPATLQVAEMAPNAASYVSFTSGSSGLPKGILGRHKSLQHFLTWQREQFCLGAETVTAQLAPVTFDVSLRDTLLPLMLGGRVTVPPRDEIAEPRHLLRWIETRGVTVLHCVPSLFRLLVQARAAQPAHERTDLRRLAFVFLAGEPLFGRDLKAWRAVADSSQRIINLYGPSETTLAKLFYEVEADAVIADGILPVGHCLPDTAALVLKPDRPALTGEIGEICIRTAFPSLGFVNAPEMTRAAFQRNPFSDQPNDILYRSGDLGRWRPDGRLECLGRRDAQVKIAGNRVEAGEVELALRGAPGIHQCAVVVNRDDPADPFLIAYVTGPGAAAVATLRAHLLGLLPGYMVPRFMVRLDALPLLMNGKVDQRALPRPEALVHGADGPLAAATPTEALLERLWQKVLGIEQIGVATPFANLGGDSLKAIKIVGEIFRATGYEMKIADFFATPTIRDLAAQLDRARRPGLAEIPVAAPAPDDPLSDSQEQLWAMQRIGMNPVAYNLCYGFRAGPELDLERLERAFRSVIAAYDILRTRIIEVDGEPRQQVVSDLAFRIEHGRLGENEDFAAASARLLRAEQERPFDLAAPPLVRVVAARALGHAETVLLISFHHVVCDGESLTIFVQRLGQAYATDGPVAAPKRQYRDIVAWQAERLRAAHGEALRHFWQAGLAGAPDAVVLPETKARPARQRFAGRTLRHDLAESLTPTLITLAQQRATSLFNLLLAGLAITLEQRTSQADMVIGTPVLGRNHPDLADQIGFFANTLPLRMQLAAEDTLTTLIERTTGSVHAALDHQDWPFRRMVAELGQERDLSRNPVCNLLLVLFDTDRPELTLPGVSLTPFGRDTEWRFSRFDLVFHVTHDRKNSTLVLDLNYDTDLFDQDQIARIARHYEVILTQIAREPDARLADLRPFDDAQAALLAALDRSGQAQQPASLTALFAAAVAAYGERVAVEDARRTLTYRELDALANGVAAELRARAVRPEEAVAVAGARSVAGIAGILGILKAGGAFLLLDERWPQARIDQALSWADVRFLLTSGKRADISGSPVRIDLDRVSPCQDAGDRSRPEQLAYVLFTSGSTGEPKAVLVEHLSVANMIREQIALFGITPASCILQFAAPVFDAAVSEIFTALLAGARLAVPSQETVENPPLLRGFMDRSGVTVATMPPSYLAVVGQDLPATLETLVTAGEPARSEDAQRFAARLRFINAYGPAENAVCSTTFRVGTADQSGPIPIGKPIGGGGLTIRDSRGRVAPIGVPGQICLFGAGLARGYLKRPELTAATFTEEPGRAGRVYLSGDLGFVRDDGEVVFVGRHDEQVKLAGQRLELAEVAAILRSAPAVAEAVVAPLGEPGRYQSLGAWVRRRPEKVSIWPSIAEFFVYDDLVYSAMATDRSRNARYAEAFRRFLPGQTVVEVGPGPYAVLSRLAIAAGAKRVYAIEINPEIAERARQTLARHGLEERVSVITGDAAEVCLPEQVDWCISEIVGSIGGSEGAAAILNAVRRRLKSPQKMLPRRSETLIAGLELPAVAIEPGFSPLAADYVRRIFAQRGRAFDLRLCLRRLDRDRLLTDSGPFESLDLTREVPLESQHQVVLRSLRDGRLTGFLLWLTLDVGANRAIDILQTTSSWLPIFVPLSLDGFELCAGDEIRLIITRTLNADGRHPDFDLDVAIQRAGATLHAFQLALPHVADRFGDSPLHAQLFDAAGEPRELSDSFLDAVRAHAVAHLPRYAVPSILREIETLPRTVSGKLARDELPELAPEASVQEEDAGEISTTARAIADVFAEVLGHPAVDPQRSFFALGGDSISAIRAVSALARNGLRTTAADIFQYQSAVALAPAVRDLTQTENQDAAGPAHLLPIHHWFLARGGGVTKRFNQSVILGLQPDTDTAALHRALAVLIDRHPALRQQLDPSSRQFASAAQRPLLRELDLRGVAAAVCEARLARLAEEIQAGFDPVAGRVFAAALLRQCEGDRLFLAAHHLAVDLVSWRILLQELACLLADPAATLAPPTASNAAVARALAREAQSATTTSERPYWEKIARLSRSLTLPSRHDADSAPGRREFVLTLTDAELSVRARDCADTGSALVTHLLYAMADAARQVFDWPVSVVDLETHGRDLPAAMPAAGDVVGWFTRITPVAVTAGANVDPVADLPRGGLGHGLLAWLREDGASLREAQAPLALNYLGDLTERVDSVWRQIDWNGLGTPVDPDFRTGHALSLLAHGAEQGLLVAVTADLRLVDARLAEDFVHALRQALGQSRALQTERRAKDVDISELAVDLGL